MAKFQPLIIIISALMGILLGRFSPAVAPRAGSLIEVFLMILLFFVFLAVDIKEIRRSFTNIRFSLAALAINFIWTPVFTFILGSLFMAGQIDLQTGFIMLMVTPCTDWYLIFTGMAGGNVSLGSSLLPLNLILQIALLPVYLLLFMGDAVSFSAGSILTSILLVLVIPLASANAVKFVIGKLPVREKFTKALAAYSDNIQLFFLCLAVVSMFASQGKLLLGNPGLFVSIFPPLIIFFIVNFILARLTGRLLKLPFKDTIPLIFTTSARNSPIALAIAAITFPERPVISLVLVIGPLIELPVLAVDAWILRKRKTT
ncbi:arsenic resistance protein [Treponema primitia]|uniref:arsenic resistance protein n=1 Tax=Treponema primitia TaxID=88058 RepID=UPI0002555022|nr:bile acid:sodium symporter [Treponema primitia]